MRINQYVAVLDTCVLAPMPVVDTLLRLAEEPASFYTPRWSADILRELRSTLKKFNFTEEETESRISSMSVAFPEALVDGYEDLISAMKNDPKDRHVLAAAVRCGANCIVSDNKKHFQEESLKPYGIECSTAAEFLEHQYHLNPDQFIAILKQQAEEIGWPLPHLLSRHVKSLASLIVT
ncbi:MAG TPA: PIN domain-containing protein [Bryobacteraceae bacterium]|jgi:predicted nucleic acid-binding protein|nr:PIN domain-containing protein [Bryobacteraceae bacterium]